MRPNNQNRRGRGRGPRKPHGGPHGGHGGGGGGQSKAHSFDSSGNASDVRVRGNAYQVLEKYLQLARDAGTAGDRVAAENFLQHADHYYRVVAAQNEGQRPRIGGREISVADMNVQNVSQGLSAAISGHGHGGDEPQQHASENQQGGHGNGQMRPNQNSGEQHNQHQNPQGQGGGDSQNANGGGNQDSDDNGGDAQGFVAPDEQPDYPEELIPADGANTAPRDGQQQEGRHGRGRGRRRGPGRRVRTEGEEGGAPPTPPQTPDDGQ